MFQPVQKNNSNTPIYTIECNDNVQLFASEKVIRESSVLNELIDNVTDSQPIPVDIDSDLMAIIINYLNLYEDDPPYVPQPEHNCQMTERDIMFFNKIEDHDLVKLLNASDYLNIRRFIEAGLMKIRNQLEGKNETEIRHILQVPDDYTEEEKEKMFEDFSTFDPNDLVVTEIPKQK
uniref:Skp1-related protein n=1 Tax=Panagrolaimus sp. JU765 TaxID=591449 RepID=A0AC34Q441_9BILA